MYWKLNYVLKLKKVNLSEVIELTLMFCPFNAISLEYLRYDIQKWIHDSS